MLEKIIAFICAAIVQGIPLLYGATGEIITEKSGNLNLGIPGIMYVGGISGIIGGYFYEKSTPEPNVVLCILIPLLACIIGSVLMSLIYGFLTITLHANQNVTGLALTTFGIGVGNFFGGSLLSFFDESGSISLLTTGTYYATPLGFSAGDINISFGFMAYLAVIIALVAAYVLKKTRVGLHLRAVGENPATADAAGINVTLYKYMATCIGGAVAGMGGLYFVMDYTTGAWTNNGFGDRGWLAVAIVIFALWKPKSAIWCSFIFGGLYIVCVYIPGLSPATKELIKMLPYVVTIFVLVFTSARKKREHQPPASLGLPYFREER